MKFEEELKKLADELTEISIKLKPIKEHKLGDIVKPIPLKDFKLQRKKIELMEKLHAIIDEERKSFMDKLKGIYNILENHEEQ